jgi:molecular chaperone GrpE (heat shock protein)
MEGYKERFLLDAIHKPMVHNLIRLYDSFLRLESELQSIYDPETGHQLLQFSRNMENFRFELTEVLARMDAELYEDHLDVSARERLRTLDRKLHKPVDVEPTPDPSQDNIVASVHKHGFYWRGKVFRPEEVKIFRHTPPETHNGEQKDG